MTIQCKTWLSTLSVLAMMTACSHITYEAKPDGSTVAEDWEFGTNKTIDGLLFETHADGSRKLNVNSLDANRVEGIKQINQGLKMITEGLSKGAVEGIK